MVLRLIRLPKRNSLLILGPRGSGKSHLIRTLFGSGRRTLWIDLLRPEEEEDYLRDPALLRQRIQSRSIARVVIDEVQKVPKLLDVAHEMIESSRIQFIMSGSSARKLKRGSANLLAGRALSYRLDPFTHRELGDRFDLEEALEFGLLPKIYFPFGPESTKPWTRAEKTAFLQTYSRTYVREEIQIEQHVRNILPFRGFLQVAAQMNGKLIDYSKIAEDVGVDHKTVAEYFNILEDTLLGFRLHPYHRSIRKRQGRKPKFYFFDPGVKRALDLTLSVNLLPQTGAYGEAFEHFILLEIRKLAEIENPDIGISFFRTRDGTQEIDLILE